MLINATQSDELRVAIIDDALLMDLDIERAGQKQKKSNIYKGRITSIEPSLGAVFVDYGSERHGFLPLKEISCEYFLTDVENSKNIDIRKVLREGQELVIQIEREERGTKGAALTTFISLAGSYLVLMPNNPRAGGISRRIEGDERDYLKETIGKLDVPEGMGAIIRTAGVGKSLDELKWDLEVLLSYWEAIKQAAIAKPGPYLIHQESDVIIRAIRDYLRKDIEEIIVDEPNAHERARNYLSQIRLDFLSRLKLYNNPLPLFSCFQIEQQIEEAYQCEVSLPSGGSMVIDMTEALIAIDINSAKATKGGNIEETAYNTNLEAAEEIARQLRIRDIGGLIVIDFIDMTSSKHQRDVENRLRKALQFDRARIQIGRISRFGLLEMSRQRLRSSLNRDTQITCPRCLGHGSIRAVESMALSIIHLIQEYTSNAKDLTIQVQLPLDIATYLLNEKRDIIKNIEDHGQAEIIIIPNAHLESPHYQIKEIKSESNRVIPSYRLAKIPKIEAAVKKTFNAKKTVEPVINEFLSTHTPASRKPHGGVIRRLWNIIFNSDDPTTAPKLQKSITKKPNKQKKELPSLGNQRHSTSRHSKKPTQKNVTRRGNRGGSRRADNNRYPLKHNNTNTLQDSNHNKLKKPDTKKLPIQKIQPVDTNKTKQSITQPILKSVEISKPTALPSNMLENKDKLQQVTTKAKKTSEETN